jgi:hypothetical protein
VAAALAGIAIYARPLLDAGAARHVLAFVVAPLLAASGVAMWQQARFRRFYARSSASGHGAPTA